MKLHCRLAKGVQIIVKVAVKNGENFWRFRIYLYALIWQIPCRAILEAKESQVTETMVTIILWTNSHLEQSCLNNFVSITRKVWILLYVIRYSNLILLLSTRLATERCHFSSIFQSIIIIMIFLTRWTRTKQISKTIALKLHQI